MVTNSASNPRDWYGLGRWKNKQRHQMRSHPLCKRCLEKGLVVAAVIADHIKPHKGNWNEFWLGSLQSLCRTCHESSKKYEEHRGYRADIGEDGLPTDPMHPFHRVRQ